MTTQIIKLNVGGHVYMTTLETLTGREPDCLLANMFKYQTTVEAALRLVDDEGEAYFIDRDGVVFRFILNYLRDGELPEGMEQDEVLAAGIMREAEYFGLFELRDEVERRRNLAICRRDLWSPEERSCCARCGLARGNAATERLGRRQSSNDDPLRGEDEPDELFHPALFKTEPDF